MAVSQISQPVPRRGSRALAETSGQPGGLTQRMLLHLLETFFRHPFIHLLPLVIFLALGCFTAFSAAKTYRSVGILNATSGTLLSELTGNTPTFGFESTATVTSRNIEQLLTTDAFLDEVIERARLTRAVELGQVSRDAIRASIAAYPQGENLIAVAATTPRPEQSELLAAATLEGFVEWVVNNDVQDAAVRIDTYEDIRDRYRTELNQAIDELNAYLLAHPAGDEDNRPVGETLDIARLQDAVNRADEALTGAETNVNDAQLAQNVARTVVTRQLRTIDEPQLPTMPTAGLRKAAMTIGMFGVLGAMLSLGTVVLAATLDRTIRIPNDVSAKFGVEVLAVVPSARK
jgi:capsular polysaccharide biosynthesis protein